MIQDRDRRAIELLGIRRAALLASRARRASISAIHRGESPVAAMRNELLGDPRINPDGLVALVRDGMIAAHLKGHRRTLINAAPRFRATGRYKLAGSAYDDALRYLQERLQTPEYVLESLSSQYGPAAARITDQLTSTLELKMSQAMLELTTSGAGVRDAIKTMRQVYRSEGMAPEANYRLEAMFRTQTQIAYSAGRENSLEDDAVQEILWGFEYVAIKDDRTTPLCNSLNGMKRPKDDPVWATFTPPNHFNALAEGTMILTKRGEIPIESVGVGEEVMTHRGRFRRVYSSMHKVSDKKVIRSLHLVSGRIMRVTDEHPVLTTKGWKRAGKLKAGDVLYEYSNQTCGTSKVLLPDPNDFPSPVDEELVSWDVVKFAAPRVVTLAINFESNHTARECKVDHVSIDNVLRSEFHFASSQNFSHQCFAGSKFFSPRFGLCDCCLLDDGVRSHRICVSHPQGTFGPCLSVAPVVCSRSLSDNIGEPVGNFGLGRLVSDGNSMPFARISKDRLSNASLAFDFSHREPEHPVLIGNQSGDRISAGSVNAHNWSPSAIVSIVDDKPTATLWNLAVEDDETYIASGVIVHNCRSTKIEIFDDDTATDVPDVKPYPGFGFNPGAVFRDALAAV